MTLSVVAMSTAQSVAHIMVPIKAAAIKTAHQPTWQHRDAVACIATRAVLHGLSCSRQRVCNCRMLCDTASSNWMQDNRRHKDW